jgi:hydrogenase large subunit
MRISSILFAVHRFLESTLFGDTLENRLALDTAGELDAWTSRLPPQGSDFCGFLQLADVLHLEDPGQGSDIFMSYGVYPGSDAHLFGRGVWQAGKTGGLDPALIREDLSHSWMAQRSSPRHPYEGVAVHTGERAPVAVQHIVRSFDPCMVCTVL